MGGVTDEIRGHSKTDVYTEYVDRTEGLDDWSIDPDPNDEEACMAEMEQDPDSGEWVLRFHAHT